ncbi:MAG TPA: recombination mediator RecR [Ignavibacteria bacterium]|nr:recombination mediator RecR [Ignavibacteria bacterium]HMQ98191.1 recombination mediator RecR [Ignavibacteria bacterium]
MQTSETLEKVAEELAKLPSIGRKTANRIAMYLAKSPSEEVIALSDALLQLKDKIRLCSVCCNITETDPCSICDSQKRSGNSICIVEEPGDVFAIEKTNEFRGKYHVLHGIISPLDGIGPEDIKVKELLMRLSGDVEEVILALNPSVEGEYTITYLSKLIKPLNIKISRIARGIPVGTDLEFADEITIAKAIEGRITL